MSKDNKEPNPPMPPGIIFEGNIAFGNGGAGFSFPAEMRGSVRANVAADNAGGGFVVRDPHSDLLEAMQLRPETPANELAKALRTLRNGSIATEDEARRLVNASGLGGWMKHNVPSFVAFAANLLKFAESPYVRLLIARMSGGGAAG